MQIIALACCLTGAAISMGTPCESKVIDRSISLPKPPTLTARNLEVPIYASTTLRPEEILRNHTPTDRMIEILILLKRLDRQFSVNLVQSPVPISSRS